MKIDPGVETDGPNDTMEDRQHRLTHSHYLNTYSASHSQTNLSRDPSFEDIFVSFATIPAYVAYRSV